LIGVAPSEVRGGPPEKQNIDLADKESERSEDTDEETSGLLEEFVAADDEEEDDDEDDADVDEDELSADETEESVGESEEEYVKEKRHKHHKRRRVAKPRSSADKSASAAARNETLVTLVRERQRKTRANVRTDVPFYTVDALTLPCDSWFPDVEPSTDDVAEDPIFDSFNLCLASPRADWMSTEFFRKYVGMLYAVAKSIGSAYRQPTIRELFLMAAMGRLGVSYADGVKGRIKCFACRKSEKVEGVYALRFLCDSLSAGCMEEFFPILQPAIMASDNGVRHLVGSVCGRRLAAISAAFRHLNAARRTTNVDTSTEARVLLYAQFTWLVGEALEAADQTYRIYR
jgi:hypothetical protein